MVLARFLSVRETLVGACSAGIRERRLVAVVTIGDDQLLILHRPQQYIDGAHVADLPHAVGHAELIGYFDLGGRGAGEEDFFRSQRRVRIEHEDLSKMRPGGAQQVQPVRLGLGKRLFVAEHYLCAVVAHLAQPDKCAPLVNLTVSARDCKTLGVSKDARIFFLGQDPHAAPIGEIPRRAGVYVIASGFVEQLRQSQDDAHQIVETALVISLLHGGGNLVVGLGHHLFHAYHARVVTECAERINSGHASGGPTPDNGDVGRAANCFSLLYLPDCT